jgi:hypothetical protein
VNCAAKIALVIVFSIYFCFARLANPICLFMKKNFVTFALGTAMVDKGNIHICLVSPKVNIMNAYNIRVESLRI